MLKANGTIAGARLKAEMVKDVNGDTYPEIFWYITVKVNADKCDANALAHYTDNLVRLTIDPVRAELPLGKKETAAA